MKRPDRHFPKPIDYVLLAVMVACLVALFWAVPAGAQPTGLIINGQGTATLTWQRPTTNIDGAPLAAADITGYGVFFGPQSRFSSGTTLRAGCAATPISLTSTTCYAGATQIAGGTTATAPITLQLSTSQTVYFALAAQKTGGGISPYSNEASKIFELAVDAPPNAPVLQNVAVSITCTTNDPQITCTFTVQ